MCPDDDQPIIEQGQNVKEIASVIYDDSTLQNGHCNLKQLLSETYDDCNHLTLFVGSTSDPQHHHHPAAVGDVQIAIHQHHGEHVALVIEETPALVSHLQARNLQEGADGG